MNQLIRVIRYDNAPALEASWGEFIPQPDTVVPATDTEPERTQATPPTPVVHVCRAYDNTQMAELAADLGDDAAQYQALMDEIAATYVPPPPPTPDELMLQYVNEMEALFDAEARGRRYDNRLTCALRAGYPGPFQAEGLAFAQWMDACNALGYQLMAEVLGGQRSMPTVPEFLAMLPQMEWPQ